MQEKERECRSLEGPSYPTPCPDKEIEGPSVKEASTGLSKSEWQNKDYHLDGVFLGAWFLRLGGAEKHLSYTEMLKPF